MSERCAGGEPLLEAAACPGRHPMWAEGSAGGVCHRPVEGVPRRGAPVRVPLLGAAACPGRPPMWAEGCAEGVCHSHAEGLRRRSVPEGCRCWKPSHALGGLLCGRRGTPEYVP